MDWITLLRSQQSDFIQRLTSSCLLHCQTEGQYSELTIIAGERLKALREFCWLMAEKYKRTSPVRDVFLNNLKGKLGEEVVKERLADLITEVDYEQRFGGDGKTDFTLTSNPAIGIEVKSRHGRIDQVRWTISAEEVAKNAVVVCILIQEDVNEAQPKYHLFLAGFLPTQMIKLRTGKISFGINQLLYGGGLKYYLGNLQTTKQINKQPYKASSTLLYIKQGDEYFNQGNYQIAITNYSQALQFNPGDANLYYKLGLARYQLGDYKAAITDFTQAIRININHSKAYHIRGLAHYQLAEYEIAIADYTEAMRINPYLGTIYKNRADARSILGDHQGAIEDYTQAMVQSPHDTVIVNLVSDHDSDADTELETEITECTQAIELNPHDADAYYKRGHARLEIGDQQGAIEDLRKAANIYWQEGKLVAHRDTQQKILDLEIEASLDILNF
jgi:tetratricopeptide (TPR) repeat protein